MDFGSGCICECGKPIEQSQAIKVVRLGASMEISDVKTHGGLDDFGDGLNQLNGLSRTHKCTHMQNLTSLAPSGIYILAGMAILACFLPRS